MTGRRVLVTGASGFTGRYVWQALQHAGFQPYALSSDLCDESAVKKEVALLKPDAVLHLAGIAYVGHGNPADFYHVNHRTSLQLHRCRSIFSFCRTENCQGLPRTPHRT